VEGCNWCGFFSRIELLKAEIKVNEN
jgi:hypothetical protein